MANLVKRLREMESKFEASNDQNVRTPLLKPCPFCGGEAEIQTWTGIHGVEARVSCKGCHVSTAREYERTTVVSETGEDITRLLAIDDAMTRWNRRV